MKKLSVALLLCLVTTLSLLSQPTRAYAKACTPGKVSTGVKPIDPAKGLRLPSNGHPFKGNTVSPGSNLEPATVCPLADAFDPNALLAWTIVAFITTTGVFVAVYPITFYITQVWRSRQKSIFETLNSDAKKLYLGLYRPSEAASASTAADIEVSFGKVYNHWFGRARLVTPALLIGLVVLAYTFLAATRATQALLPAPTWRSPFTVQPIALAAMTGAYVLVTMDTIARVVRRDLLPEDLQLTALRLVACVPLGYAFASLVQPAPAAPFVALALTAIPLQQVAVMLRQLAGKRLGMDSSTPATGPSIDAPSQLSGVDQTVCERLGAIGVNTITQIAYSDPVQLTMRTSVSFIFILDIVSQALAWVYLEGKLNALRAMGLRGSFEIAALKQEADAGDANAQAMIQQLPGTLGLSPEQCNNVLHRIADDPYVRFLLIAYA